MKVYSYINRLNNRLIRWWREKVFAEIIDSNHCNFRLLVKCNVINRNIILGKYCVIYPDVTFWGDGPIEIGDNVRIGQGTILYASNGGGISIGNDTQIAAYCYLIDMDHGTAKGTLIRKQQNHVAKITIGHDCWLGTGCKVLRGSIIHDGAIIGAASVVKGEILANSIAVGIPAHSIRKRK